MTRELRAFDLFCGAGGSSWGAQLAGAQIVGGLDADELAGEAFADNFKDAEFFGTKAENLSPSKVAEKVGRVDLLLASPECTNHTVARGGARRQEDSRRTAFQVARYASALKPTWIVVENVIQMRDWARYSDMLDQLHDMGYQSSELVLNSADFGVPQNRRRLFILLDSKRPPPIDVRPSRGVRRKSARDVVEMNGKYAMSPLHSKRRAKATLVRANRAITAVGRTKPFLLVYYGTDGAGGWQRIGAPLRTVTTLDRFALVRRQQGRHMMRMLQVPELKAAMGFNNKFQLNRGTRRDKIRLLGNAVCPPVMKAIVRSLCPSVR